MADSVVDSILAARYFRAGEKALKTSAGVLLMLSARHLRKQTNTLRQ